MPVFLVRLRSDGDLWRPLGDSPTFYGLNSVTGAERARKDALFAASTSGVRCVIEWIATSRPCPFPSGKERLDLGHGDSFEFDGKRYLAYVEAEGTTWTTPAESLRAESAAALSQLGELPGAELIAAASRFLALPYTSAWWRDEFVSATGFEQYRDGNVPAVRTCHAQLDSQGVEIQWSVEIQNDATWTKRPERALFMRRVLSDHLLVLLDCATRLRALQPAA